ncbi:hypothetical protein LRAMOSA07850 [Lichtheimia ramosa]|uniref:Peptidase S8/S53 domain-containing protein n=1 Tax=Lichtheimia ramosa TaxID=688394 RepID=A0A077WC76_9FUNG|nr:hypothetical protein LRAMOSA07850 [Lichtheimia ramosa]
MVKISIFASSILVLAVSTATAAAASIPATLFDPWRGIGDGYHDDSRLLAPLYRSSDTEIIKDSYIIVLKDHVDTHAHCHWVTNFSKKKRSVDELEDMEMGIRQTYHQNGWKGYAGRFSPTMIQQIRSSPEVAYVEHDSMMYASELQRNAPWGLARISHRRGISLWTFNKYPHDENGGDGVNVFVVDTGININHVDFEGRASWGATFASDGDTDGNGHGSHCAGTIAGRRFGVAKQAMPVAVKVLSAQGSGSNSDVLAGINWVIEKSRADREQAKKMGTRYKGAVANMSLGGGKSRALDQAVNSAVQNGVVFAVAAGNDGRDACQYSPAAAEQAITVGATNLRDERAYFSSYGPCVDVFAPGQDIMSVWNNGNYGTNTISGTSMASPHVAGLAAYFLSLEEEDNVSPKVIKDKILKTATRNMLSNVPRDTPNLMIYNGFLET